MSSKLVCLIRRSAPVPDCSIKLHTTSYMSTDTATRFSLEGRQIYIPTSLTGGRQPCQHLKRWKTYIPSSQGAVFIPILHYSHWLDSTVYLRT